MDNEILEELFASKMTVIYKYLIKIGCGRADAEDIVQETFLKAVIYLEAIDAKKMSSWLFRVALNHYYDLCRKNRRIPLLSLPEIETGVLNNILAEDYLPEKNYLCNEKRKQVSQVLGRLSATYNNLLVLKYVQGLSYQEITEMVGVNERTVKTYLYRARQKFKELWGELDYE